MRIILATRRLLLLWGINSAMRVSASGSTTSFSPFPRRATRNVRNVERRKRGLAASALGARGGAYFTKEAVVNGITGYGLAQGLSRAFDPARFWKDIGDIKDIKRGSVAEWAGEYNGWIILCMSTLTLLSLLTNLSPVEVAALSTIPSLFFFGKGVWSGSMDNLGFIQAYGPFMILHSLFALGVTFCRATETETLERYLYAPLAIMGLAGWLFPEIAADDVGIELKQPVDKALWIFTSCSLMSLSTLLYTMFFDNEGDISKAIRNAAIVTSVTTLDVVFVRRSALMRDAGFSSTKAKQFLMFILSVTFLMLYLPNK